MTILLEALQVKKVFNRRVIFDDVTFSLSGRSTLLVTGRNGSGKSTLLKILAHVLTPTAGTSRILIDGTDQTTNRYSLIGFVSPYLSLYEEFSARENMAFALAIRGMHQDHQLIDRLLDRVALGGAKDVPARTFSSGMKQRLKYAFALVHRPPILFLDEPMSNLDSEGKATVRTIIEEQTREGALVVATNDRSDVEQWEVHVDLDGAK